MRYSLCSRGKNMEVEVKNKLTKNTKKWCKMMRKLVHGIIAIIIVDRIPPFGKISMAPPLFHLI